MLHIYWTEQVRFISGLGLHSAGGVSAIKTDLERCFDAWKLRWRWEHGTFTVVTSDTPARIGRTDGWTDRRSESQSRPQVTMASKAELAPWLNTSAARAWTHGSGGADLTAPESFPALGSSTLSKDRKKSETSVWRQSSKPRKRAPDAKVPRKQPQPQAPNQEGLTSELVAQYQQWRRRQPQQQHPGDVAGGAAAATVGLVRQLSNSCRRATVSAEVELVAAEAQIDRDTAELDMVREQAVDELVSWG